MDSTIIDIWVYLARTPLLWLTATLLVFQGAQWLFVRTRGFPLLNPVLVSVVVLVLLLQATGTPYETYFDGAQFVHFLLGPATVALAIPLYRQLERLRQNALPVAVALLGGAAVGVLSAVLVGRLVGVSDVAIRSLVPKSVTTPIAMGITEQLGGLPSLTAVFVILTGIIGAILGRELLLLAGVRRSNEVGFALGLAAHGIGTARGFSIDDEAGAFAGLAMALNGAVTAVLAPLLARWLGLL